MSMWQVQAGSVRNTRLLLFCVGAAAVPARDGVPQRAMPCHIADLRLYDRVLSFLFLVLHLAAQSHAHPPDKADV